MPQDLEAEACVLGALLLDQGAIAKVYDVLDPDGADFYRTNNGQIYKAAMNLFRDQSPIDNITLAAELEKMGILEQVGGRANLAMLQEATPTAANVQHYAERVKEKAGKRSVIAAGTAVVEKGFDDSVTAREAATEGMKPLLTVVQEERRKGLVRVGDHLGELLEEIKARKGGQLPGLSTGFYDLDRVTAGLRPGELVVIGGRPSMGKTSLGMQLGVTAAADDHKVAVFSLEMTQMQVEERALCTMAHVDSYRLSRGMCGFDELAKIEAAMLDFAKYELYIDDSSTQRTIDLIAQMQSQQAASPVSLMIVDYLTLVDGTRNRDNRVVEVGEVSRALKALAKDLAIPVVVIAQLSRAPEGREDKRPILSDLRESGNIEQDADQVWFLYRDEYYKKEKTAAEDRGIAEVIVAKNRNGAVGTVKLRWDPTYTEFQSLESRQHAGTGGPQY
jgi:replicative DNA helicase